MFCRLVLNPDKWNYKNTKLIRCDDEYKLIYIDKILSQIKEVMDQCIYDDRSQTHFIRLYSDDPD